MIKKYIVFIVVLLSLTGLTFYLYDTTTDDYSIERTIKYSITLSNPTNRFVDAANMWIYVPVAKTSIQEFVSLETSYDHALLTDEEGNQKILYKFSNIPPYGTKVVTVKTHLRAANRPVDIKHGDIDLYLRHENNIETNSPLIKEQAGRLKKKNPDKTAESIYSWVSNNMKYTGFSSQDKSSIYALKTKQGDCTEYSYLYTALARAAGLPSRIMSGFVYDKNTRLDVRDYHNWSEVYLDGKWQIVDTQKGVFMRNSSDYVAMRIVSSDKNNVDSGSQVFFHVDYPLVARIN